MADTALVVYRERYDSDNVRSLVLPSYLPESRQRLLQMAARFTDPALLNWLCGLPIYDGDFEVLLSKKYVIHMKGEGSNPFWCGTQGQDDSKGTEMPLNQAVLEIVDPETFKKIKPWPCRICFSLGMLVFQKEEEDHGTTA